jgi:hypothetical protein
MVPLMVVHCEALIVEGIDMLAVACGRWVEMRKSPNVISDDQYSVSISIGRFDANTLMRCFSGFGEVVKCSNLVDS